MIQPETLDFLRELAQHNEKPWFEANKARYERGRANAEAFMGLLLEGLQESDVLEGAHLYRIYRDVRFSKDKTPYKTSFSGVLQRQRPQRRGSYWIQIAPGDTLIGGGFYGPSKDDLHRIRKELEQDGQEMARILGDPAFVETFGRLQGEGLKTAPKGFEADHPNIALIRQKQFYAFRRFSDEEVLDPDFPQAALAACLRLRPFFDFMTQALTTDLNGEPLHL